MPMFYDENLGRAYKAIEDKLKIFFEICMATEFLDHDVEHKYALFARESKINTLINEGIIAKAEYLFLKDAQKLKDSGNKDDILSIAKVTSHTNPVVRISDAILCNYDALTPKLCEYFKLERPTRSNSDGKTLNGRKIEAYLSEFEQMINEFGEISHDKFACKYKTPSKYTYCSNIFRNEQSIQNTRCNISDDETQVIVEHKFNDIAESMMILNQIAEIDNYSTGFDDGSLYLKTNSNITNINYTAIEIIYNLTEGRYIPKSVALNAILEDDNNRCIQSPIYIEHLVGENKYYFEKYIDNFNNKIIHEIYDKRKETEEQLEKHLASIAQKFMTKKREKSNLNEMAKVEI